MRKEGLKTDRSSMKLELRIDSQRTTSAPSVDSTMAQNQP